MGVPVGVPLPLEEAAPGSSRRAGGAHTGPSAAGCALTSAPYLALALKGDDQHIQEAVEGGEMNPTAVFLAERRAGPSRRGAGAKALGRRVRTCQPREWSEGAERGEGEEQIWRCFCF